jgi:hypothetical protein
MVQQCDVCTVAECSRLHEFSCLCYLRFRIAYRLERCFKTAVRAVRVPATVLWEVDGVFVDNTKPSDATAIVLRHQVALRLQEAAAVVGVACLLQCWLCCCSHLYFPAGPGWVRNLSPPVIQP